MVTTLTRQTGVLARVIDENVNSWEDWAGQDINIPVAYQYAVGAGADEWEQAHWAYRGQAALCARTTDGALVRVRIGDGSTADWTVYRQIITDPTDPAQWVAWTQLYTGTHYAIAIQADASAGAGYRVFHAKSDGLYVDNTLKITKTGITKIKPVVGNGVDTTGIVYFQTVDQDRDGERAFIWWFTPDVNAGSPTTIEDCATYRWYRHDLLAFFTDTAPGGSSFDYFYRFRAMAHDGAARNKLASTTLTCEQGAYYSITHSLYNLWQNVRSLKGPSAQAGYKTISDLCLTTITDDSYVSGAHYLFYTERHRDAVGNVLSNLKNPLFWSRSVGVPYYLSAPVPTGFSVWGLAGVVVWDGYIYVGGNGRVIRRPQNSTRIDISNYVLDGDYELPRDNGKGEAKLICPNPHNVLGSQLGMTDADTVGTTERRVELAVGLKRPGDSDYTWKADASWWISMMRKIRDESGRERLEISLGDFWHRMENPYRDTYQIPGRLEWTDWQPDAVNQLYNYSVDGAPEMTRYSPAGADEETVPRLRATPALEGLNEGVVLFAGWRGENGQIKARLWDWGGLIFRYVDEDNYYKVLVNSTGFHLYRRVGGTATMLAQVLWAYTQPDGEWMEVHFRWGRIQAWWNGQLLIDHDLAEPEMFTGFAGVIADYPNLIEFSNLKIEEWTQWMTVRELIRILLAHADEHNVELELDEQTASLPQLNVLWGPQSDSDAPDKSLRQLLETARLNIVWKQL